MFDSGISANELIESVRLEIDAALPIEIKAYVEWLNEIEQLAYSEIIQEKRCSLFENLIAKDSCPTYTFKTSDIETYNDIQSPITFKDICGIYHNGIQLLRIDNEYERIPFKNSYWYDTNKDAVSIYIPDKKRRGTETYVYYYIRPVMKTVDSSGNMTGGNVMFPIEFISTVKAKLRAEAYKLVNEGTHASNWLNEYNYGIENFKIWVNNKKNSFGK